ncbi:MAG: S8 family serine peptidase [Akkermansiaceae bacterium]|nr:S8 family serine peptidase [Akkermansiaceae bacterium]
MAEPWITPEDARHALEAGDGKGVRIAILDSGIDLTHPGLAHADFDDDLAILSEGGRVSLRESGDGDVFGHGTAVAGIIHQIAPAATLGSIRVLGHFKESRAAIIREGIRQAAHRGYHIVQCSFGAPARPQDAAVYKSWIDALYLRGVHIVAAGSNTGFQTAEWPAHFPTVIGVGADPDGRPGLYRAGGGLIEFATRGEDDSALWPGGGTRKLVGSSFAAPRVAALLARILTLHPGLHPLLAKAALRAVAAPPQR